ncbi:hypothetical protein ACSDQ9_04785 [Aestuariimicrobium soli]|uniref:hypothetical protein n=1 Tax=Aestuariimicrobium soli TaxID=2035834 RepID=UPI003EBCB031
MSACVDRRQKTWRSAGSPESVGDLELLTAEVAPLVDGTLRITTIVLLPVDACG